MVKHNNPTISEDASRLFNTKTGDMLGSEVNPIIQPTVEILRKCNVVRHLSRTATGSQAVYVTPTDKDFYLVGCTLSYHANGACDNTSVQLVVSIDAVTRVILLLSKLTTTELQDSAEITFPIPIKVDRGSNIIILSTFTAGAINYSGTVIGYTVEVTKGV